MRWILAGLLAMSMFSSAVASQFVFTFSGSADGLGGAHHEEHLYQVTGGQDIYAFVTATGQFESAHSSFHVMISADGAFSWHSAATPPAVIAKPAFSHGSYIFTPDQLLTVSITYLISNVSGFSYNGFVSINADNVVAVNTDTVLATPLPDSLPGSLFLLLAIAGVYMFKGPIRSGQMLNRYQA